MVEMKTGVPNALRLFMMTLRVLLIIFRVEILMRLSLSRSLSPAEGMIRLNLLWRHKLRELWQRLANSVDR